MCGQDLKGWVLSSPNSLSTLCFECICVYTPSDRIGRVAMELKPLQFTGKDHTAFIPVIAEVRITA